MKVLKTDITTALNGHIIITIHKGRRFSTSLHSHPELELVYIKSGAGKRILGDTIDRFNKGDIVLMGSELPHRWVNDNSETSPCAIVVYFNREVFSEGFYALKESRKLAELFAKAKRGLNITGPVREIVAAKMEKLVKKSGLKKIIALLDILHIISTAKDVNYIAGESNTTAFKHASVDRLAEVYQYITANYQKDISLPEITAVANLTAPAFCRLFKQRTNKSFVDYLNEIRVTEACRYLHETDLNISSIYTLCGFKTISNFNKRFKQITGYSPKEYRQNMKMMQD